MQLSNARVEVLYSCMMAQQATKTTHVFIYCFAHAQTVHCTIDFNMSRILTCQIPVEGKDRNTFLDDTHPS